jgi:hypothetical protein
MDAGSDETAALAAALGYGESDFDSLLEAPIAVSIPVYAGERQQLMLPTPYDLQRPASVVLADSGILAFTVSRADGTRLPGRIRIQPVDWRSRRTPKAHLFALPAGSAELASVALDRSYELEIQVDGVGGHISHTVDGPRSSGERTQVDLVLDDWTRIVAVLQDESGAPLVTEKVRMVFHCGGPPRELDVTTDSRGRLEVFAPQLSGTRRVEAIDLIDNFSDPGPAGPERRMRSVHLKIAGVLSSCEDLGTVTLK